MGFDADDGIGKKVQSACPQQRDAWRRQVPVLGPDAEQDVANINLTKGANSSTSRIDCPQREARIGWTGDCPSTSGRPRSTASERSSRRVGRSGRRQRADGQFPDGRAGQGAATRRSRLGRGRRGDVICPWTCSKSPREKRLLEKHYRRLVRFIESAASGSTPELLPPKPIPFASAMAQHQRDTPKGSDLPEYFRTAARA